MKLNSDNPDLMPITDAVYGKKTVRPDKPSRGQRPRSLADALDQETLDALTQLGGGKRDAARRRHAVGNGRPERDSL